MLRVSDPYLMWQVCAKPCSQEQKHCDELEAWSLRLDAELIANSAFVESVQPSEFQRKAVTSSSA